MLYYLLLFLSFHALRLTYRQDLLFGLASLKAALTCFDAYYPDPHSMPSAYRTSVANSQLSHLSKDLNTEIELVPQGFRCC